MVCSRVQNLLSAYCDRELTGAEMLDIRSHLDRCQSCRHEHDTLLQVKRLMGALGSAEPPRAFDPACLETATSRGWGWAELKWAARPLLSEARFIAEDTASFLRRQYRHFHTLPTRLALSGTVGIVLVTTALFHAPQHPDAISAQVPELVPLEDRSLTAASFGELPPVVVSAPLADEVSAVRAAQVIGAEEPIHQVAYYDGVPVRALVGRAYPRYPVYAAPAYAPVFSSRYRGVVPVDFLSQP
jgi:hypothetical protein